MAPRRFDGRRVRAVRRAADLTQSQVAEALEVADATVASWETGLSAPDGERLPSLAAALGDGLEDLFPRSGPPDLADLRCDAGYSQYQTKDITGTKSAGPVANAERGVRRLGEDFVPPLAAAYGVSVEELLAAQERSFGNEAPAPAVSGTRRRDVPRTLPEKIDYLIEHARRTGRKQMDDAQIAAAVNEQAGAEIITAVGVRELRTGACQEVSADVLDGLAAAFDVPPQYFRPDEEAVRELAANLELLASFRRGEVDAVAARNGAVNTRLVAYLNDLLDDIEEGKLPGEGSEDDLG